MNKKEEKFFKAVRRKIEVAPSKDFDQRFWQKFDRMTVKEGLRPVHLESSPSILDLIREKLWGRQLAYATVTAFSLLLVLYFSIYQPKQEQRVALEIMKMDQYQPKKEQRTAMEIMKMEVAIENIEIMAELEEIPNNDEEWKVLLEGGS